MEQKVGPEHLREREDPLSVSNVGENPVLEQFGEDHRPLGTTGGTESAAFTGECHQELGLTFRAKDAGEARFEKSTIQVAEDGGIPKGSPEPYRRSNRSSHRRLRLSKWVSRS